MPDFNHLKWFPTGCFLMFFILNFAGAQSTATPFDLLPRIEKAAPDDSIAITTSSNPFDIVKIRPQNRPEATGPGFRVERQQKPLSAKEKEDVYRRFIFITILLMMIIMTLVVTLFRILIAKIWKAFLNDNLLNQLQREQSSGITLAYSILYVLFFINAGIFAFLTCKYFGLELARTNVGGLFLLIGGIAAFFLAKHLILRLLTFIFPIKKEMSTYQFTIVIFNIVLGLFLAIAVLFFAYAPSESTKYLMYGSLGLIAIAYLFRNLRGMFIANRFLSRHKFHFLLYLCAVEIAPIAVILKLLMSQGQG
jgi:hypothetical protein